MPRDPRIPGQEHPQVLSYVDVLLRGAPVGRKVAIVGAGGIGFDMAEYLATGTDLGHRSPTLDLEAWRREWGVADPAELRGGVMRAEPAPPARQVTLLQRKAGKPGVGLGKTTGWIHRAALKMKGVEMLAGVNYERIGPYQGGLGLFVSFGEQRPKRTPALTWPGCSRRRWKTWSACMPGPCRPGSKMQLVKRPLPSR